MERRHQKDRKTQFTLVRIISAADYFRGSRALACNNLCSSGMNIQAAAAACARRHLNIQAAACARRHLNIQAAAAACPQKHFGQCASSSWYSRARQPTVAHLRCSSNATRACSKRVVNLQRKALGDKGTIRRAGCWLLKQLDVTSKSGTARRTESYPSVGLL